MKKIFSMFLILSFLIFAFTVPAIAEDEPENGSGLQSGNSLKIVLPEGGAYVIIGKLKPGELEFNFGWNNVNAFETAPVGYWIGVYDITDSHYLWVDTDEFTDDAPKMLKLCSEEAELEADYDNPYELISGHEYGINFFVRDFYDDTPNNWVDNTTNVVELTVFFTAP